MTTIKDTANSTLTHRGRADYKPVQPPRFTLQQLQELGHLAFWKRLTLDKHLSA